MKSAHCLRQIKYPDLDNTRAWPLRAQMSAEHLHAAATGVQRNIPDGALMMELLLWWKQFWLTLKMDRSRSMMCVSVT
jgi:hypothetical protein